LFSLFSLAFVAQTIQMETISDKSLQLAKLCGVCTYLVDRIDDSIKQAKSATWTDRIIYPHAYTSTTWLSSARGGCAVCIRLLDSVMIQHGKVKGLTSPRTHEVIEGAEMSISCTVDNNIRISNGEMERVVTFRACSKNQIDHAEAAARVVALPRVEGMFCFHSPQRLFCCISYIEHLLNLSCRSEAIASGHLNWW
jgi:hypothetical protein